MSRARGKSRHIALFVEGDTERETLPDFFHRWLDPQLPLGGRVGISAVKFQGVGNYLDDMPKKMELYLDSGKANFIVGLVDLYGIAPERIDLSRCTTVKEKVDAARVQIRSLVSEPHRELFHQHFAVHEIEAWLLAYPEEWPSRIRPQIEKIGNPETVNFMEPPAKFLKRLLGRYKKITSAKSILSKVDPQIAFDRCPYLRSLMRDLLEIARRLQ